MNNSSIKPTSEILERIYRNSEAHPDEVFTRLYRYLCREDIYFKAFQKLYANKGALTKGTNDDTADGFSEQYVQDLIADLREGRYKATPVRREYILKKNGKYRPLGIPSFRDKLLQEAVRMILESIYEPVFDSRSHGFRPGRGCHTALEYTKKAFNGTTWFIEGDIHACFDCIDHQVLLSMLSNKIKDRRFIGVIREFLKAGYVDDWKYYDTYSGCPQGGIVSPILANIYLDALDKKVRDIEERFNRKGSASGRCSKEYNRLTNKMSRLNARIDKTEDTELRGELLAEYQQLRQERDQMPSTPNDQKRLAYVRYADDWLIGVKGSKEDCIDIKKEIGEFLGKELKLELSEEKTLITHSANKVRFLGYDIRVRRNQEAKRVKRKDGTTYKRRTLSQSVELLVPLDEKITAFLLKVGAVIQRPNGELWARYRGKLQNLPDVEIVHTYNAEIRGILNYYCLASNYNKLSWFRKLMEQSCLRTIARKHDTSIRKVKEKYKDGKSWSIPYVTRNGEKCASICKLDKCEKKYRGDEIKRHVYHPWKLSIRKRLKKGICEYCGVAMVNHGVVHVVRKLKDLKGNTAIERTMRAKRRKTLVICQECNLLLRPA